MSRKCSLTGKGSLKGHSVSHSRVHTQKVSQANLKTKRLFDSESQRWVRVKVSARVLRTIDKKGLAATLRGLGRTAKDLA